MKTKFLLPTLFICMQIFAANKNHTSSDMQFIKNEGQWNLNALYSASIKGGSVYFEKNCFTYHFISTGHEHPKNEAAEKKGHAFKMWFQDANNDVQVNGISAVANYYNYFLSDNPAEWKSQVPAFEQIEYSGLYHNIDLKVYSAHGNMKYDYILRPGAEVTNIQIKYEGIDALEIENENLKITTSINNIFELKPYAYQIINQQKKEISCNYVIHGNTVMYEFPEGYDKNFDLIIDPASLVFSTYSGSSSDNWGFASTNDNAGNLIAASLIFGNEYPVITGSYDTNFNGGVGAYPCDIAITKFSADGKSLLYSTYLGGSGNEIPFNMICNAAGELFIMGITGSDNFPCSALAYDTTFNGGASVTFDDVIDFPNGTDIFLSKLSDDGSLLSASSYFGGSGNDGANENLGYYNYNDFSRAGIFADITGACIIASNTKSIDLPVSASAYQTENAGQQDGFVAKFDEALSAVLFSTYIGSHEDDVVYDIKSNSLNEYIICGSTNGETFPVTAGAYSSGYNGGSMDGFVATFNEDGSALVSSTYIGTDKTDQVFYLDADAENNIYITGQSTGDFPVLGAVYSNPGSSQFISKIHSSLDDLLFSTVIGNGSDSVNFSPTAFDVDDCNYIYLSGWGGEVNNVFNTETGNMNDLPITPGSFLPTTDGSDFYFLQLEENAASLIYASYFGGNFSKEHIDGGGGKIHEGIMYHAVCAGCGGYDDFPVTDSAWSAINGSFNCNLGVFKFAFETGSASAAFTYEIDPETFTVTFTNTSSNADMYLWDFGDLTVTTDTSSSEYATYTYPGEGMYVVTLIAEGCSSDTLTITISVLTDDIQSENNFIQSVIVYPNPASGNFSVLINSDKALQANFSLLDVTAKVIINYGEQKIHAGNTTFNLNTEDIASGMYFLQLKNETESNVIPVSIE